VSNSTTTNTVSRYWEHYPLIDSAPGQSDYVINFGNSAINSDEMHIVVSDEGGKFTGVPGTVLETYRAVSRATDSKTVDGGANYWKTVINDASQYVYAVNDMSGAASATADNLANSTLDIESYRMQLGKDGKDEANIEQSILLTSYDKFASAEDVDISLILQGKARSFTLANYLIDNIAEKRKDCIVLISPQKGDVVNNIGNEADAVVNFRNNVRSTSYAVMDSGYKYMYDRYNDIYRWIPLNGDTAGLCVRTDQTNDPWWSPAGFNRGQIKNIVKLAYNPRQADRDTLYKAGVNPVVTFPGQGTILFGDKTLLAKPSAFDRINVRRLFIVLEKAIATASKFTLFEFNDAFTRAQFKNLVVPYLRDVQGRRGIYDFLVVCDATNNTPEIIDRNEFVGDIYIKPARSINFINLNFVAVRTGVSFSEIVGQF
jgi:phage tail sheath protein FI